MRKVWKWIIGIAIVLVAVAALVCGALILRSHFNEARVVQLERPAQQAPRTGKTPFGDNGEGQRGWPGQGPGMMPFGGNGRHMRGPGMMGFGGMMPFVGAFVCLVSLGFLVLVILGVIWLVRRQHKPMTVDAAAAPVAPVEVLAGTAHPCKKCGQPVQEGWNHCPNCGRKQ
jgi:hypothetical protein